MLTCYLGTRLRSIRGAFIPCMSIHQRLRASRSSSAKADGTFSRRYVLSPPYRHGFVDASIERIPQVKSSKTTRRGPRHSLQRESSSSRSHIVHSHAARDRPKTYTKPANLPSWNLNLPPYVPSIHPDYNPSFHIPECPRNWGTGRQRALSGRRRLHILSQV